MMKKKIKKDDVLRITNRYGKMLHFEVDGFWDPRYKNYIGVEAHRLSKPKSGRVKGEWVSWGRSRALMIDTKSNREISHGKVENLGKLR